MDTEMVKVGQI